VLSEAGRADQALTVLARGEVANPTRSRELAAFAERIRRTRLP
jgi:hypothetical protein